jgi:putative SOS response-associated peptidase YedK
MRWGFLSPPQAKSPYATNVRKTTSNFWRPWLKTKNRCLVPVTSFCEYDWRSGKAVPTCFALDESRPLFFFAGKVSQPESISSQLTGRFQEGHFRPTMKSWK